MHTNAADDPPTREREAIIKAWATQEEARRRIVDGLPADTPSLERAAIATYYTLFPFDLSRQHWHQIDEGARTLMRRVARANMEAIQGHHLDANYAADFDAFQDEVANSPQARLDRQERSPVHEPNTAPKEEIADQYVRDTPSGRRGVNLGCGGMTFKGWLNIDESQPWHCDIECDLTEGMPFLPGGQFDVVYSEAFLEHVSRKHAAVILRDAYRALRPGGHIRIAIPDLASLIRLYLLGAKDPVDAGGQIRDEYGEVFGTRCELFNLAMRAWGHSYMYDRAEINRLFESAGFVDIRPCDIRASSVQLLHNRENRPVHEVSLITEGTKPM